MKLVSSSVALLSLFAIVGCQNTGSSPKQSSLGGSNDVTDVRPVDTVRPAAYEPAPVQPMAVQPISDPTPMPAPAYSVTPDRTASSSTHIVKHGDTLYSIARQTYGDGKQWQRIAAANPGVTPTTLKVGQTLVIP